MMRGLGVVLLGLALTGPSAAASQALPTPVVEVRLSSFEFTPATVQLRVGEEHILRLIGTGGSHNFSAPGLFAASRIDPASAGRIRHGTIELREGDSVDIRLTPLTRGTYVIRCTHLLHTAYGMKGEAIVG